MNVPFGKKEPDDLRRQATEIIWKYATGMLAISIALVGVSRSVIIPLVVVFGAAVATAVVWAFTPQEKKSSTDLAELEERIRKIDDRLSNVETISNFDRILAEKTAASERENAK
jgi:hypothetical protein